MKTTNQDTKENRGVLTYVPNRDREDEAEEIGTVVLCWGGDEFMGEEPKRRKVMSVYITDGNPDTFYLLLFLGNGERKEYEHESAQECIAWIAFERGCSVANLDAIPHSTRGI